MVSVEDVLNAIERFKEGERPSNYRKPDWSHVVHKDAVFPTKAIWSLASNIPLADFNTNLARHEFALLGFETVDIGKYDAQAKQMLQKSGSSSRSERLRRLAEANEYPTETVRVTKNYIRNADVIVEVLHRAQGICENCEELAPFIRASDGTPYLEVHHKKQLANGGKDTIENAIALCPNCHRQMHHG